MRSRRPSKVPLSRSGPEEPSYLDTEIAALEAIVGLEEDGEKRPDPERPSEEKDHVDDVDDR